MNRSLKEKLNHLFNQSISVFKNGYEYREPKSEFSGLDIIIGIDSSKANTAIFVKTPSKTPLGDFEIQGGGASISVLDMNAVIFNLIDVVFAGANILAVGIESPVTRRQSEENRGMVEHEVRIKLTSLYAALSLAFYYLYSVKPIDVNNQQWKTHCLPAKYRTREFKKGSVEYMKEHDRAYTNRTDDICDAYFICDFICDSIEGYKLKLEDEKSAHPLKPIYNYGISLEYPNGIYVNQDKDFNEFEYNNRFSLLHNISFIDRATNPKQKGFVSFIKKDDVPLSLIKFLGTDVNMEDTQVKLVVVRTQ